MNWIVVFGKNKKYLVFADTLFDAIDIVVDRHPNEKIGNYFFMDEYLTRKYIFQLCLHLRKQIADEITKNKVKTKPKGKMEIRINNLFYVQSIKDALHPIDAILLAVLHHIDHFVGMFEEVMPMDIQVDGEKCDDFISDLKQDFEKCQQIAISKIKKAISDFAQNDKYKCVTQNLDDYDRIYS